MIEDEMQFDLNKTYFLVILQGKDKLCFTAHKTYFKKPVLSFFDKFNQQLSFNIDNQTTKILQVREVKQ